MTFLERAWQKEAGWLILLWPVSIVFRLLSIIRRNIQRPGSRPQSHKVPVIVIGNLSVGGTGKTPLLIALANHLQAEGIKPGVISRGYGGQAASYPLTVSANTAVDQCGDEALLTLEKTKCPVVVAPDREAALVWLLENNDVDVILSDDGLQHYRLHRDLEICVVDGQRLFGNGYCLPAGPLREPVSRLKVIKHIVVNGMREKQLDELESATTMQLTPKFLINLVTKEKRPFSGAPFNIGKKVQAVSAIGNPRRFYELLQRLPYQMQEFSFPDHHLFSYEDFTSRGIDAHQPVVMTEKDAVKCREFAHNNFWYLSSEVDIPQPFLTEVTEEVRALCKME